MMKPALRPPMLAPLREALAPGEGVGGFSLPAFMAGQTDGLYFDTTQLDRFFQENTGPTLADDVGEAIGLALDQRSWNGQTLAQIVAAATELVVNGNFSVGTGWTLLSGWAISGGAAVVTAAAAFTSASQAFGFVAGKTYQVTYDVVAASAGSVRPVFLNGTQTTGTARTAPGTYTELLVAQAGNNWFAMQAGSGGFTGSIDNVSVKLIPGNHGVQATGNLKPVRQSAGAKFDGSDDNWLSTYAPGSGANFAVVLLTVPASVGSLQIFLGANDAGLNYAFLGIDAATGKLRYGVGTTLANSPGGAIIGQTLVVGLTWDGAGSFRVFQDNAEVVSSTYGGTPPTSQPFRIGARNSSGSPINYFSGSVSRVLAGREFLALARYQQIRSSLLA